MLERIDADLAAHLLLQCIAEPGTEEIPLSDGAGRVLAQDMYASIPMPPFDRSPYDGYAVRAADTAHASKENPVTLRIVEEIRAGDVPRCRVDAGTAAKILTGAPIPEGADAVVKFEDTVFTLTALTIMAPVLPGTNIAYAGEDLPAGRQLAGRGERISAPVAGALAGQGLASVHVFRKPDITVLSTGSELLKTGYPPEAAKIYNSNVYTLCGMLAAEGTLPRDGGTVEDDPHAIAAAIENALSCADIVVTTGGVSVGDYDYMREAARLLGAQPLFWRVNIRPGGSILACEKGGKLLLCLSGNAGAAVVGFLRVVLPGIRKSCGRRDVFLEAVQVRLRESFHKKSPMTRMLRGRLLIEDAEAFIVVGGSQGGGDIASMIDFDLLGEIQAGSPPLEAGTIITAHRTPQG